MEDQDLLNLVKFFGIMLKYVGLIVNTSILTEKHKPRKYISSQNHMVLGRRDLITYYKMYTLSMLDESS